LAAVIILGVITNLDQGTNQIACLPIALPPIAMPVTLQAIAAVFRISLFLSFIVADECHLPGSYYP
jgi:hypothetical protein